MAEPAGRQVAPPVEVLGTPTVDRSHTVRLVDLLGAGVAGALWSAGSGAPGRDRANFLDLAGAVKPYRSTTSTTTWGL